MDYFSYVRTLRLRQPSKQRFFHGLVMLFLFFFLISYLFFNNGFRFDLALFITFGLLMMSMITRNSSQDISMFSIYPITYRKRIFYHFIYAVTNAIIAFALLLSMFLLIFLFTWIFNPNSITYEESLLPELPLYYYGLLTSMSGFYLMIGYIKNDRNWRLISFFGLLVYVLISILVAYISTSSINPRNLTEMLLDNPNNVIWINAIAVILFSSFIGFYLVALSLRKNKKPAS